MTGWVGHKDCSPAGSEGSWRATWGQCVYLLCCAVRHSAVPCASPDAGCEPTGHAYSAAISACAAAGDWRRAVALFEEMTGPRAIRPDVVSCTALITALAAGGEADRAEAVVGWMLSAAVRPNARTFTALMAALGNAKRWGRAVEVLRRMQTPEWGSVAPNAYTYSALLKVGEAVVEGCLCHLGAATCPARVCVTSMAVPAGP